MLIPILELYIRRQKEKLLKNGLSYYPERFLFTTDSCESIDDKNLLRAWQRVLKKADVRYRNFHTLRHTYATKLFEKGIPLITVSRLLGHSNVQITADTYECVKMGATNFQIFFMNPNSPAQTISICFSPYTSTLSTNKSTSSLSSFSIVSSGRNSESLPSITSFPALIASNCS